MMSINGEAVNVFSNNLGNVEALYGANADSTAQAEYVYSPYGEVLMQSGELAEANPIRFSTRYSEANTGLMYYNFRHYSPKMKKWINKDPIGESGGFNLYAFVGNDPVNKWDLLGQFAAPDGCCEVGPGKVKVPYHTSIQCCEENKPGYLYIYSKEAIFTTGVSMVRKSNWWRLIHVWIEHPKGSVGFYPLDKNRSTYTKINTYITASPIPGQIESPESILYYEGGGTIKRKPEELKPCDYNIDLFVQCIEKVKNKRAPYYEGWLYDCESWAKQQIRICKEDAKRDF